MTLNFNTLFHQRDVRETPAATATATAVGLTNPEYVTLATDADLSNERVLAVNTTDLTLTDGGAGSTVTIALKNKTSYWSTPGWAFKGRTQGDASSSEYLYGGGDAMLQAEESLFVGCPVFLPHGAIVTEVIVNGNISDETWTLYRAPRTTAIGVAMATNNLNSSDSTITNATIDNNTYTYHFFTSSIDTGDQIYGARITYTTDYN